MQINVLRRTTLAISSNTEGIVNIVSSDEWKDYGYHASYKGTGRGHIPTKHDPSTADKKAEIRTLQYRVAELKSSVRNAKLAKKYQESEAGSLDALIGKWKRASQEAAQYLVEQMVDYDNGNDYYTSSWTTSTVPVNHGEAQASALARDNSDDSQTSSLPVLDKEPKKAAVAAESSNSGVEEEVTRQRSRYSQAKFRAKLDMVCERIDYQDTVEDLPTVEEAIRCHEYVGEDDERGYSPKKLPKMQRLLLGLKIDPNLLGYNAVLDEFTEGTRHG
ncbi:hypothetical protein BGZ73_006001 [Actinomortierella ambigua]|nr:hypothetical protein BGZ73_006001 [Actinomortierella ambigua]